MVARSENLDRSRTVEDTTTKSENLDRTVEVTAANCLMLLSRVGEPGGRDGEGRVFRCKTCMQGFSSFQALGGHRASHNASHNKRDIINTSGDEQSSLSSGPVTKKRTKKTRPHRCSICGLEFPTGQALGGHMRKHRDKEDSGAGALVTRLFFPEATATPRFTTFKKSSSGKKLACLDLGSDSSEGTINLKLELGRTIN